jgi:predicted short-subunit dehydrogenase-like oxidoreductase (DUF2520 family)
VLHTCGARGVAAIEELARAGVACGVLHPLQAVSSPQQGVAALPGAAFAISGEGEAAAWARRIVALLNGTPCTSGPGAKRSIMRGGHGQQLRRRVIDASVEFAAPAGVPEDEALCAIRPLVETNARKALTLTPSARLPGHRTRRRRNGSAAPRRVTGRRARMRQLYCTLDCGCWTWPGGAAR